MDFAYSARCKDYIARVSAFMDKYVYEGDEIYARQHQDFGPGEGRWKVPPIIDELKAKAKAEGLWNMFHPNPKFGPGLSNADYAPIAELTGRCHIAPEVFNCAAPDTGNMEVLMKYGTPAQQEEWLTPLLEGKIRSAFLMTEPQVASSDATNIETDIRRDGDDYVINGRKWFSSGAGHPKCEIFIVMGKTDPEAARHLQQSMILVPRDTPGVTVLRPLSVFGYDDAPHGHMEVLLENVRVPAANILLGEGRGFEIAQGRLGPGRIHHCMRSIGAAERALELMIDRLSARVAFGQPLSAQSIWHERIAESRCMIDQARLLTMNAAKMMDTVGNKGAHTEIQAIKIAVPETVQWILDKAIQVHGGGGLSQDFPLAYMYASIRTLRFADGPDEVHREAIAKMELRKYE